MISQKDDEIIKAFVAKASDNSMIWLPKWLVAILWMNSCLTVIFGAIILILWWGLIS